MGNEEIKNVVKILGLQYGKKYTDRLDLNTLRYGKLMIMADQDQDGSHIKGLVINFIHHNWPHLLKHEFVEEFITPIVKVSGCGQELWVWFRGKGEHCMCIGVHERCFVIAKKIHFRQLKAKTRSLSFPCLSLRNGNLTLIIHTHGRSNITKVWVPARVRRPRSISLTWTNTECPLNILETKTTRPLNW